MIEASTMRSWPIAAHPQARIDYGRRIVARPILHVLTGWKIVVRCCPRRGRFRRRSGTRGRAELFRLEACERGLGGDAAGEPQRIHRNLAILVALQVARV